MRREKLHYKSLATRLPTMGGLASHCHERFYTLRVEGGERRKGTEKEGKFSCNLALSATAALSEYSGDYMLNAEFALSTPSSLFVGFLRAKLWLTADRGVELDLSYALSKMLFNFNFFFKTLLQDVRRSLEVCLMVMRRNIDLGKKGVEEVAFLAMVCGDGSLETIEESSKWREK
ncbi:hypothetical protein HKD37_05G013532 [Glycine soja]